MISVLKMLQCVALFQAVFFTLEDTVFPFKTQTAYLWLTFFLCISDMKFWTIRIWVNYKQYLISVLKMLQGVPLFQDVASTLFDNVLPFKHKTIYLWLTLFLCIYKYVSNLLSYGTLFPPSSTIIVFLWYSGSITRRY